MSFDTVGNSFIRSGTLAVASNPTTALQVATKQYVDAATNFGFVTVGVTGAQYTSLNAAIAAGKYNMHVITAIAEPSDLNIGNNGEYHIYFDPNTSDNFTTYKINILNGTTADLFFYNGTLLYSYGSAQAFITYSGTGQGDITANNLHVINTSTADQCYFNDTPSSYGSRQHFYNCQFELPDQADGGLQITAGISNGIEFVSGGSNCAGAISANRAILNGIEYLGSTWSSSTNGSFVGCQVNGLFVSNAIGTPLVRIDLWTNSSLTNAVGESTAGLRVVFFSSSVLTNFDLGDLGEFFLGFSSDSCSISNGRTPQGNVTTSGANVRINNVRFTNGDCTIQGKGALLSNCDFDAGCVVDADNVQLVNVTCGASGGAANTIAIVAGADNCNIANCVTEIAIVDSGTGTNIVNNQIWI